MVLSKDLKIAIFFGLIMGAILSVCNLCFAAESEDVSYSVANGVAIDVTNSKLISNDYQRVYYINLEKGYNYTLTIPSSMSNFRYGFGNSLEPNSVVFSASYVGSANDFTFTFNSDNYEYLYFIFGDLSGPIESISVTREQIPGISYFIDDIAYSLSIGELSGVWNLAVPILAISVLFGLGFYLLKRLLNRIKRAKGGA